MSSHKRLLGVLYLKMYRRETYGIIFKIFPMLQGCCLQLKSYLFFIFKWNILTVLFLPHDFKCPVITPCHYTSYKFTKYSHQFFYFVSFYNSFYISINNFSQLFKTTFKIIITNFPFLTDSFKSPLTHLTAKIR